ncbi:hypothetical protein SAMN05216404_11811 [Nitrosospira multiformis]|uniref:Uncharacterized protein n=1 Tax=Nitrosospira multiformis TaxID=1231 RepID=A0A1H8NY74_9PROT|nr:hypothetical protein SAMN05216404_11811 [Nitrosospira multiformis]
MTKVDEVLDWFRIPASILGPNSILQFEPLWTFTQSTSLKKFTISVGGATIFTRTWYAKTAEAPMIILANRNSLTSQITPYSDGYMSGGIWKPATFTIDFTLNQIVEFRGYRENSNDSLNLEYYRVLHLVGD